MLDDGLEKRQSKAIQFKRILFYIFVSVASVFNPVKIYKYEIIEENLPNRNMYPKLHQRIAKEKVIQIITHFVFFF